VNNPGGTSWESPAHSNEAQDVPQLHLLPRHHQSHVEGTPTREGGWKSALALSPPPSPVHRCLLKTAQLAPAQDRQRHMLACPPRPRARATKHLALALHFPLSDSLPWAKPTLLLHLAPPCHPCHWLQRLRSPGPSISLQMVPQMVLGRQWSQGKKRLEAATQ